MSNFFTPKSTFINKERLTQAPIKAVRKIVEQGFDKDGNYVTIFSDGSETISPQSNAQFVRSKRGIPSDFEEEVVNMRGEDEVEFLQAEKKIRKEPLRQLNETASSSNVDATMIKNGQAQSSSRVLSKNPSSSVQTMNKEPAIEEKSQQGKNFCFF